MSKIIICRLIGMILGLGMFATVVTGTQKNATSFEVDGSDVTISTEVVAREEIQPFIELIPAESYIEPEETESIEPQETETSIVETTEIEETVECEFAYAHLVWDTLSQEGFKAPVIAGILGNMMTECGGQTLALQPEIYSPDGCYYGLCQWCDAYYEKVHGTTIYFQLNFLIKNIRQEFECFGPAFGISFNEFMELTNPEIAALYFAKVYERCEQGSYSIRQDNALEAYYHFT